MTRASGVTILSVGIGVKTRYDLSEMINIASATETDEFEFTSDGNSRYKGYVRLSGLKYETIDMDAYKIESEI